MSDHPNVVQFKPKEPAASPTEGELLEALELSETPARLRQIRASVARFHRGDRSSVAELMGTLLAESPLVCDAKVTS